MTLVRVPRITDRLAALSALRPLLVGLALALPAITGEWTDDLVVVAAIEVAVAIAAELARRFWRDGAKRFAPLVACLDGSFVVACLALTGGLSSPVMVVMYVLIAAKVLLISGRAGVGIAVWSGFLLLAVHAAADGGVLSLPLPMPDEEVAVAAASFVVFALLVAAGAHLSELGLRRGGERLAALVDLGEQLDRADRDDDVLVALVHHVCSTLRFGRAAVLIRRGPDWRGASVLDGSTPSSFVRSGDLDEIGQWVMAQDRPELVRALSPGLLGDVLGEATNVVVVPVSADGERFGVLVAELGGRPGGRIPAGSVHALVDAAAHAALTLRNRAMVDEIERLATRDALTGLANRRLLQETIDLELARARRQDTPLSVVVVDVDHFKEVNDTHGHLAGDEVLRGVGEALVASTKAFDLAARYGGDEFVVVLPGCPRDAVVGVAERLREAVAKEVRSLAVTVSAGVATLPDDAQDGERLLIAADAALYEAKRAGRDRVATPPDPISWRH